MCGTTFAGNLAAPQAGLALGASSDYISDQALNAAQTLGEAESWAHRAVSAIRVAAFYRRQTILPLT